MSGDIIPLGRGATSPRVAKAEKADQELLASLPPLRRDERYVPDRVDEEITERGLVFINPLSAEELERARQTLDQACAPASHNAIVQALLKLKLTTKDRAESEQTMSLRAQAYVDFIESGSYPLDVLESACEACASIRTFFPSWHELKVELDRAFSLRCQIRQALRGRPTLAGYEEPTSSAKEIADAEADKRQREDAARIARKSFTAEPKTTSSSFRPIDRVVLRDDEGLLKRARELLSGKEETK